MWLYHRIMSPNDADGMANCVDPDQTAPGLPVCPGISVRKLRIITVDITVLANWTVYLLCNAGILIYPSIILRGHHCTTEIHVRIRKQCCPWLGSLPWLALLTSVVLKMSACWYFMQDVSNYKMTFCKSSSLCKLMQGQHFKSMIKLCYDGLVIKFYF